MTLSHLRRNAPLVRAALAFVACLFLAACRRGPEAAAVSAPPPVAAATPVYTYTVVNVYPHDARAFTEGLLFLDGDLYESTGLAGQSSLRRVDLFTGKIEQRLDLPADYFGEGLAALGGKLYQLSYTNETGFVYDLKTFKRERAFHYTGEGWGLASDGKSLLMSDGTDQIRFLDPETLGTTRTIHVTDRGSPVANVNELEMVKGEIYANVWRTTLVACVDPATGAVLRWIDFQGLLQPGEQPVNIGDFPQNNGIAYDPREDRLFVTGKCWPKLFEVRIKPR